MGPLAAAIFFIAMSVIPPSAVEIYLKGDTVAITGVKQANGKWQFRADKDGKIAYTLFEKGKLGRLHLSKTTVMRERTIGEGSTKMVDGKDVNKVLKLEHIKDWQSFTSVPFNPVSFGENPGSMQLERKDNSVVVKKGKIVPMDLEISWKTK